MKAQSGSRGIALSFFSLGTRWGWVVKATPLPLYPRKWHSTHCIGGCVSPRAGLDGCRKFCPNWDATARPSSPQWTALPTILFWPIVLYVGMKTNILLWVPVSLYPGNTWFKYQSSYLNHRLCTRKGQICVNNLVRVINNFHSLYTVNPLWVSITRGEITSLF